MTTHTDLIARLRAYPTRDGVEAVDALESLEQQVAALTQEKGVYAAANRAAYDGMTAALEQLVAARADAKQADQFTHKALDERDHYLRELQAAQADNARLREALMGLRRHSLCPDTMVRLLDTPTDDSALMERLKQERERCAKVCHDYGVDQRRHPLTTNGAWDCADAIRGLA